MGLPVFIHMFHVFLLCDSQRVWQEIHELSMSILFGPVGGREPILIADVGIHTLRDQQLGHLSEALLGSYVQTRKPIFVLHRRIASALDE